MNRRFADQAARAAAEDDIVLVQDYQLSLVPGFLRERRPDLRIVHFSHTPFCEPGSIRVLPDDVAVALCSSMASVRCGFHTSVGRPRTRRACARSSGPMPRSPVRSPRLSLRTLPSLHAVAGSAAARAAADELDELVGDRALLLRTDRIDPSKNVVRGFLAYDRLLEEHPEWRERVVFVAMLNASRETLAEYVAYRQEVEQAVERVNERGRRRLGSRSCSTSATTSPAASPASAATTCCSSIR